ncbi:MAG: hypothetical protein V1813_00870, partial [Candidatus Aenigmatarchaeota archaeon]
MAAGTPCPYPVFCIGGRNYVDITDDANPVMVWAPNGCYRAPNIVSAEKMPACKSMPEDLQAIKQLSPKAKVQRLSYGEAYQIG